MIALPLGMSKVHELAIDINVYQEEEGRSVTFICCAGYLGLTRFCFCQLQHTCAQIDIGMDSGADFPFGNARASDHERNVDVFVVTSSLPWVAPMRAQRESVVGFWIDQQGLGFGEDWHSQVYMMKLLFQSSQNA